MTEEWRPVVGLEDRYEVSNLGHVRNAKTGRIRKLNKGETTGYYQLSLWNGERHVNSMLHRVLAEAFISNPENKPQVNHIDYDRTNNQLSNLEWATASENIAHGYNFRGPSKVRGELHGRSKLTEREVLEIREKLKENTQVYIAQEYEVSFQLVSRIALRKNWTHI